MFSNDIFYAIKITYATGMGTFEQVCKAAGLDYYKAGNNPLKKRGTPTTNVNGKVYDFHGFLKLCKIDIVKHERLTAGGERIPAHRSRVEKVEAARMMFINRLIEIAGIKPESDDVNLNDFLYKADAAAAELDKKEAADREKAMQAAKVERKRKAAAAKVEKSSEEDKLYLAAAALGVSVEELKAIKKNLKPAKVTK